MELPSVDVGIENHDEHIVEIGKNDPMSEEVPTTEFRGHQDMSRTRAPY